MLTNVSPSTFNSRLFTAGWFTYAVPVFKRELLKEAVNEHDLDPLTRWPNRSNNIKETLNTSPTVWINALCIDEAMENGNPAKSGPYDAELFPKLVLANVSLSFPHPENKYVEIAPP
jgi:hypothetical protein